MVNLEEGHLINVFLELKSSSQDGVAFIFVISRGY